MGINKKATDRYFKIAGVPVVAIFAISLYNLLDTKEIINWSFLDYLFVLLAAFVIWFGNVTIDKLFREKHYQNNKMPAHMPVRYAGHIVYSFTSSYLLLNAWNFVLHASAYQFYTILALQVILTLVCLQLISIREIVFLNNERESDLVKIERTEKLKIQAQLDVLKNQIDPHFIFNSLNTLSYLISQNQKSAHLFNDTLARVYRYILINKEKDLVLLKEEIEFSSNYFYLLKIRYQTGLSMIIKMDNIITEKYLIPPLSLQGLIENAIKHNLFSEKMPLNIEITITEDEVKVINKKNIKKYDIQTSRIGLANLGERYSLIVNKNISIIQTEEYFTVLLPILKS